MRTIFPTTIISHYEWLLQQLSWQQQYQHPWLALVIISGTALIYIISTMFMRNKQRPRFRQLIGWPIVGRSLEFLPSRLLNTLKTYPIKYGRYVECQLFGFHSYIVTDADVAREMFMMRPKKLRRGRRLETIARVVNMTESLFFSNGVHHWGRLRRVQNIPFAAFI